MGEHKPVRIARALGAASLALGAVIALSSCAAHGAMPGSSASMSDAATAVVTPTPTPTETAAATPAPTAASTPIATPTPTAAADGRAAVVPFITTADWDSGAQALDVSAIVTGVVEGDGTCTITVTDGSTTRTATAPGVAASSYTGCQAVAVKGLTAGSWRVTVTYSSPKSVGTSAVKTAQAG